ncbi:tetratricopeptide repeat protein [Ekhidna sp.]|uniref:tetratricopeptide repeat protein n=1 Tax=Ekhidna sp. TaxID=2608089 RepID=UPI003BACE131
MNKLFICLTILIIGCTQQPKKDVVSIQADYQRYLQKESKDTTPILKKVDLWKKKIDQQPKGFTFYEKLGSSYNELFEATGNVYYLNQADSCYKISNRLTQGRWKIPSLLGLSSLAIKKHDFESAAQFAVQARELTSEKFGPLLMQFDAEMELGNYQMAGSILKENKRMDSFDYLVRLSKYKDYEGDLDSAIYYMEEAHSLIKRHQKERLLWASANLGDMYGHAGRVKDSYGKYLEVLELDPTYDYALKGIAWVAYSHDGKAADAINILETLRKKSAMPDYHLLLADICTQEGFEDAAMRLKTEFIREATKPKYGGMYNKYLIELYNDRGQFDKAMALAEEELNNRPTPAAYDWLAWTMYNQGMTEEAIEIYEDNIKGKTFEPDVIYHMGVVYHASNRVEGEEFLKESLEAGYELGPLVTEEIKGLLKS